MTLQIAWFKSATDMADKVNNAPINPDTLKHVWPCEDGRGTVWAAFNWTEQDSDAWVKANGYANLIAKTAERN